MKAFLEIGSAALTLIGVIASIRGTYVLIGWIQPMSFADFIWSVIVMAGRALIFRFEKTKKEENVAQGLALSEENKQKSLHGLSWIFLGFVLQTAGGIMLLLDTYWINFVVEKSHS
jgi:hypothetical protein